MGFYTAKKFLLLGLDESLWGGFYYYLVDFDIGSNGSVILLI